MLCCTNNRRSTIDYSFFLNVQLNFTELLLDTNYKKVERSPTENLYIMLILTGCLRVTCVHTFIYCFFYTSHSQKPPYPNWPRSEGKGQNKEKSVKVKYLAIRGNKAICVIYLYIYISSDLVDWFSCFCGGTQHTGGIYLWLVVPRSLFRVKSRACNLIVVPLRSLFDDTHIHTCQKKIGVLSSSHCMLFILDKE